MDIQSNSNCSHMEVTLRQNHLFSRLSDEHIKEMCEFSKFTNLSEGEVLFNHGDPAENFYYVDEGLIKLYRQSTFGHEKIFEFEGTGRIFSEAVLFNEQTTYPVSAAAMKKSKVVSISTRKFLNIIKKSPDTGLMFMDNLSRRLNVLTNVVEQLSIHTGRNRVAIYFLDQTINKGNEFKLEIPKNAIASMLSLQPETFSRLLKEFCKLNVLEVRDCHIRILDEELLRKQAGLI